MSKPFISWLVQRLWVDHPVLSTWRWPGGIGGSGGPVARVRGRTVLVPRSAGGAGPVLEVTETRSELRRA